MQNKVYVGDTELAHVEPALQIPLIHVRLRQSYLGKSLTRLRSRLHEFQRQSDKQSADEVRDTLLIVAEKISMLDTIRKQNDRPKYAAYVEFCQMSD